MTYRRWLYTLLLIAVLLPSGALGGDLEDLKSSDPQERAKAAERLGDRKDAVHISALAELLNDPVVDVRQTVVAAIVRIGTQHSLEPLTVATRDSVAAIQTTAVDGLVNFYYPGYVKSGWTAALKNLNDSLKDRLRKPSPVVVDRYLEVSPDVISAIARVIVGGSSMDSRANAARAAGILRGKAALPQLTQSLRSKDTSVILESVRAIEKLREPGAGEAMVFLLQDLDQDVQMAVVEAVGTLRIQEAIPDLVGLVKTARKKEVRRESLVSLAKMGDEGQRPLFLKHLKGKDKRMRAAAAEGLARIGEPGDLQIVIDAFAQEKSSESARLSMAFAAVALGDSSYLNYLFDGLNSLFHRGEARPFLIELSRRPEVLSELYRPLTTGTKDQRQELASIVAINGNEETLEHLEKLTHDEDAEVAGAAIRALRNLRARL